MTIGVEGFEPTRLALARERRGLTQKKLSEDVGVSDRMIKAYESGDKHPTPETLDQIARVLAFPRGFFSAPPIEPLTLDAVSFRALSKASAGLRNRTIAAGALALELHRFLLERFELPRSDIPDLGTLGPSEAAAELRRRWALDEDQPIANIVHLLELHGVAVFSLSEDCREIDAFSMWRNDTPFIFLNNRKTAERSVFDAAHELGHLVLHRSQPPQGREAETQADAFAASFLLPERAMRATAPRLATIANLALMKRTWKVSVAALGHRLHELRMISDWHYKHLNIELSRRGRANEPSPIPRQTSAVMKKVLAALAEESCTVRDIARELHLPASEVQSLAFGPALVEGSGKASTPPRGTLKVVR